MTIKDKILLTILSILTLGIYPIVLFKGKNNPVNTSLSVGNKVTIKIDKLISIIGKSNIVNVTNTHTKIKIEFSKGTKIDPNELKSINGVSGVFATSSSVTLLVGNSASIIASAIKKEI